MVPKTLGAWEVGELVGSGAYGQVFACKLGKAPKSLAAEAAAVREREWVMKVAETEEKGKGKSKKKSIQSFGATQIDFENTMYRTLAEQGLATWCTPERPGYSNWKYKQDETGYTFMVMERLGQSLEAAVSECGGKAPVQVAFSVVAQIIYILKDIHTHGYVYRDIKPENFLFGPEERSNRVYVIDFGAAEKFVISTGKQTTEQSAANGTPLFMSTHVHDCEPLGRRDDLISLSYMALWMMVGSLPWEKCSSANAINEMKKELTPEVLTAAIDDRAASTILLTFFKEVLSLKRTEKPDYDRLSGIFLKHLGEKKGLDGLLTRKLEWTSTRKPKMTSSTTRTSRKSKGAVVPSDVEEVDEVSQSDSESSREQSAREKIAATKKKAVSRPKTAKKEVVVDLTAEVKKTTRKSRTRKVIEEEEDDESEANEQENDVENSTRNQKATEELAVESERREVKRQKLRDTTNVRRSERIRSLEESRNVRNALFGGLIGGIVYLAIYCANNTGA